MSRALPAGNPTLPCVSSVVRVAPLVSVTVHFGLSSRPAKCPPHRPHPGICLPGGNTPTASGNCSHHGLSPQAGSGRPATRLPSLISVSPAFSTRLKIETTLIHGHGNNEEGYHRGQERSRALRLTSHSVSWHKCILVAG